MICVVERDLTLYQREVDRAAEREAAIEAASEQLYDTLVLDALPSWALTETVIDALIEAAWVEAERRVDNPPEEDGV